MTDADLKTPDAATTWVDHLPPRFRPYLRLMRADRPVGVWLLFLPCVWGVMAGRLETTRAEEFWQLSLLFLVGAFVMRSAGCIYNDIVDKDIDAQVARTANRPLAAGLVSMKEAWALLVALCLVGLVILLQLNGVAILVGLLSLALVAAYPFMKRITWWPQAWLGLTFNWGILVGGAAVSGQISLPLLLLYAAGIFWTLGYDTIYAHQDREDDALVGVKSAARRLGQNSRTAVAGFYGLTILSAGLALFLSGAREGLILLLPAALHFAWQIWRLDIDDGEACLRLFKSNVTAGALLALAMVAA